MELLEVRTGMDLLKRAYDGALEPVRFHAGHAVYLRRAGEDALLVAVNRWCDGEGVALPDGFASAVALAGPPPVDGRLWIPAEEVCLLGIGPWTSAWDDTV
mgnify:CR=1 FL=1